MAQLRAYGKIKIMNKQAECPIFEAINTYLAEQGDCWHMPGHGQGRAFSAYWPELAEVARWDVTEVPGLDSWHQPEACIAAAEALLTDAYGTKASFFLVEGASAGIQALLAATVSLKGRRIAVPRWAHASVFNALILTGAEPVFYSPQYLQEWQLLIGPRADQIPLHVDGIVLQYPSYEGIAWPLSEWMQIYRRQTEAVILVDEAHGALYPWHEGLPVSAVSLGCDGVVHGLHKTGPAVTQTGFLHLAGDRLSPNWVRKNLSMLTTTSPSYLFLASLDLARRELFFNARERVGQMLAWMAELRWQLRQTGAELFEQDYLPPGYQLDQSRILLRFPGYSGRELAAKLRQKKIIVEKAEADRVLLLLNYAYKPEQGETLIKALTEIKPRLGKNSIGQQGQVIPAVNPLVMLPREAWLSPKEKVAVTRACNRVAAETIAPCPPGVAIVFPGEMIKSETIAALKTSGIEEIWVVK